MTRTSSGELLSLTSEGPIPIITLYKALGLPLPSISNGTLEEKSVQLSRLWRTFKSTFSTCHPVKDEKKETNNMPKLIRLDAETRDKFRRLEKVKRPRVLMKTCTVDAYIDKPPRGSPPGFDSSTIKRFANKYIIREGPYRLEGLSLNSAAMHILNTEPELSSLRVDPYSVEIVNSFKELAKEGLCRISPDGKRFGIQIPSSLRQELLPIIDPIIVNDYWSKLGRRLIEVETFNKCVLAVSATLTPSTSINVSVAFVVAFVKLSYL